MAEVLGIVASGISVANLAGQLLGCVDKLRTLSRAIRDLPQELEHVVNELTILGGIFHQLGTLHVGIQHTEAASILQASLAHCQTAATTLEILAEKTRYPLTKDKKRSWHLVKGVMRREEIKELQQHLEAAKSMLHLSMTCYSLNMQHTRMAELELQQATNRNLLASPERSPPVKDELVSLPMPNIANRRELQVASNHSAGPKSLCALGKCYCICHSTKTTSGSFWAMKLPIGSLWQSCDKRSCANYKRASLWISLHKIGVPYALLANLDIMWTFQYSSISPSLQVMRIVTWNSPAFTLLRDIRWNNVDLQDARDKMVKLFDAGMASPLDILPDGKTLSEALLTLPWPNGDAQLKLLEMLVYLGAPINTTGMLYRCARWNWLGPWRTGLDDHSPAHTHLLSTLQRLGFDASEVEAPCLSGWPRECSPMMAGQHDDPFFIEWLSKAVREYPGFGGLSPLQEAVLIGSIEDVKSCLDKSSCDDRNMLRQSALHLAVCRYQHLPKLLEAGLDINARDWNGRTPLVYSAATGSVEVAITLIENGADIWQKDNLYGNHDFMHYAVRTGNWSLAIAVLNVVRKSPLFTSHEVRSLLNDAIILWAGETSRERTSEHFKNLLEWGADPEIRHRGRDRWEWRVSSSNTLLHSITNIDDFDVLMEFGFKSINCPNDNGAHALMNVAEICNAPLLLRHLDVGSAANHQDNGGRTALHTSIEGLWRQFLSDGPIQSNFQSRTLDCAQVLLCHGSDPLIGDNCRCACSTDGCAPAHILLKENRHYPGRFYPLDQYIWSLEWIHLLRDVKGSDSGNSSLLEMIRLARFEILELTHTCCRKNGNPRRLWEFIADGEVDEIMDEERYMIADLHGQMEDLKAAPKAELDGIWLKELYNLLKVRARRSQSTRSPYEHNNESHEHLLSEYYDVDSINRYSTWIENQRMKHLISSEKGMRWYLQQKRWASDFLAMIQTAP